MNPPLLDPATEKYFLEIWRQRDSHRNETLLQHQCHFVWLYAMWGVNWSN